MSNSTAHPHETKLACAALTVIVINVAIVIAIIFIKSREECVMYNTHGWNQLAFKTDDKWFASFLIVPNNILIGSAAIISDKWALTSNLCVTESLKWPKSRRVLQDINKKDHEICKFVCHQKFNLALVKVKNSFNTDYIVALNYVSKMQLNETEATLMMWGKQKQIKNNVLLHVSVVLNTEEYCSRRLGSDVYPNLICGTNDNNMSFSFYRLYPGGALIQEDNLIGIVSSSVDMKELITFINVTAFTDWIVKCIYK